MTETPTPDAVIAELREQAALRRREARATLREVRDAERCERAIAVIEAQQCEIAERHARDEIEALRKFARKIVDAALDGHDAYGGDVQDWAVEAGLLREVTATEACDPDHCACAAVGDFPQTCYRWTERGGEC